MTESSPEVTAYLKDIFTVLRCQGYFLSVAGMSGSRSRLGNVQEQSLDVISLLVGDADLLFDSDEVEEQRDPYEHLWGVKNKMDQGEWIAPSVNVTTEQKDLLTDLRVVYHWAEEVAKETKYGNAYANVPVGWPVGIVSRMLDPLVDQEQAMKKWISLQPEPEKPLTENFLNFSEAFRLRVKFELHPINITDFQNNFRPQNYSGTSM